VRRPVLAGWQSASGHVRQPRRRSIAAEHTFHATSLAPAVPATLRRLAELQPGTLAIMHGGSYRGDGGAALLALADANESEFPVTRWPQARQPLRR